MGQGDRASHQVGLEGWHGSDHRQPLGVQKKILGGNEQVLH